MAVNLSPVGGVAAQFFNNTGSAVLSGGKLYTYAAGTTTPAVTYTSSNGLTAWTNPIVLDAAGRVPGSGEIWLTDGINYKFVLKDANDVLIATYDNISGINSNFVAYTNSQEIQTATAGQTVFTLTTMQYQPATNSLSVFVDGVNQYGPGAQYSYVETDSTTVTFNAGLHVGAEVKFTTTQQQGAGAVDASQVTYDPPFTGSVPTNVEAKLAQYVSVKDFGAVGDGVADDTAAIQTALDYLSNVTTYAGAQGSLYFAPGSYLFSSTLSIPSNIKIFGAGKNFATQLVPAASFSGTEAILINGVGSNDGYQYRIEISDLTINATNFPSGNTLLLIQNAYTLRFHNIFFYNSLSTLVKVTTSGSDQVNDVLFSFCSVYGANQSVPFGFEIGGSSEINELRIIDCDIENVATGIRVDGDSKVSIVNPYMERVTQAVDCRQVDPGFVSIVNPHIFAGPDVGVSIGFGLTQCDNTTIVGGQIQGNSGAIYLAAAQVRPQNVQIVGTTYSSVVDPKNWITNLASTEESWLQTSKVKNTKTVANGIATDVYKITLNNSAGEIAVFDMSVRATLAGTSIWSARYKIAAVTDGVTGIYDTTVTEYAKVSVDGSPTNYTLNVNVTASVVGYELTVQVSQTLGGLLGAGTANSTTYTEGELICNNPLGYTYIETV